MGQESGGRDFEMKRMTDDERYMKEAVRQAKKAALLGDVPIGCVIVYEGKIIARGYNRRNTDKNTLSHAELNAILNCNGKSLKDASIYVALFPCNECAKAIIQAGIKTIVYGCDKYGDTPAVKASKRMLDAAGVRYYQYSPTGRKVELEL